MTRKAHDNGRKIYVLDTNILLSSPNAIFGFDNNVVVIAATTLQELDLKKTVPGEIGFNAREAGRHIEELRVKGDLRHGVEINESKGIFKIIPDDITKLPLGFSGDRPDNRIIGATLNNRVAQAGLDLDKKCGGEGCSTEQLKQIAEERELEERRVSEAVSDGYGWVMRNPANSYVGGGIVVNSNSGMRYDLNSWM